MRPILERNQELISCGQELISCGLHTADHWIVPFLDLIWHNNIADHGVVISRSAVLFGLIYIPISSGIVLFGLIYVPISSGIVLFGFIYTPISSGIV
jgi:hypothetical protein